MPLHTRAQNSPRLAGNQRASFYPSPYTALPSAESAIEYNERIDQSILNHTQPHGWLGEQHTASAIPSLSRRRTHGTNQVKKTSANMTKNKPGNSYRYASSSLPPHPQHSAPPLFLGRTTTCAPGLDDARHTWAKSYEDTGSPPREKHIALVNLMSVDGYQPATSPLAPPAFGLAAGVNIVPEMLHSRVHANPLQRSVAATPTATTTAPLFAAESEGAVERAGGYKSTIQLIPSCYAYERQSCPRLFHWWEERQQIRVTVAAQEDVSRALHTELQDMIVALVTRKEADLYHSHGRTGVVNSDTANSFLSSPRGAQSLTQEGKQNQGGTMHGNTNMTTMTNNRAAYTTTIAVRATAGGVSLYDLHGIFSSARYALHRRAVAVLTSLLNKSASSSRDLHETHPESAERQDYVRVLLDTEKAILSDCNSNESGIEDDDDNKNNSTNNTQQQQHIGQCVSNECSHATSSKPSAPSADSLLPSAISLPPERIAMPVTALETALAVTLLWHALQLAQTKLPHMSFALTLYTHYLLPHVYRHYGTLQSVLPMPGSLSRQLTQFAGLPMAAQVHFWATQTAQQARHDSAYSAYALQSLSLRTWRHAVRVRQRRTVTLHLVSLRWQQLRSRLWLQMIWSAWRARVGVQSCCSAMGHVWREYETFVQQSAVTRRVCLSAGLSMPTSRSLSSAYSGASYSSVNEQPEQNARSSLLRGNSVSKTRIGACAGAQDSSAHMSTQSTTAEKTTCDVLNGTDCPIVVPRMTQLTLMTPSKQLPMTRTNTFQATTRARIDADAAQQQQKCHLPSPTSAIPAAPSSMLCCSYGLNGASRAQIVARKLCVSATHYKPARLATRAGAVEKDTSPADDTANNNNDNDAATVTAPTSSTDESFDSLRTRAEMNVLTSPATAAAHAISPAPPSSATNAASAPPAYTNALACASTSCPAVAADSMPETQMSIPELVSHTFAPMLRQLRELDEVCHYLRQEVAIQANRTRQLERERASLKAREQALQADLLRTVEEKLAYCNEVQEREERLRLCDRRIAQLKSRLRAHRHRPWQKLLLRMAGEMVSVSTRVAETMDESRLKRDRTGAPNNNNNNNSSSSSSTNNTSNGNNNNYRNSKPDTRSASSHNTSRLGTRRSMLPQLSARTSLTRTRVNHVGGSERRAHLHQRSGSNTLSKKATNTSPDRSHPRRCRSSSSSSSNEDSVSSTKTNAYAGSVSDGTNSVAALSCHSTQDHNSHHNRDASTTHDGKHDTDATTHEDSKCNTVAALWTNREEETKAMPRHPSQALQSSYAQGGAQHGAAHTDGTAAMLDSQLAEEAEERRLFGKLAPVLLRSINTLPHALTILFDWANSCLDDLQSLDDLRGGVLSGRFTTFTEEVRSGVLLSRLLYYLALPRYRACTANYQATEGARYASFSTTPHAETNTPNHVLDDSSSSSSSSDEDEDERVVARRFAQCKEYGAEGHVDHAERRRQLLQRRNVQLDTPFPIYAECFGDILTMSRTERMTLLLQFATELTAGVVLNASALPACADAAPTSAVEMIVRDMRAEQAYNNNNNNNNNNSSGEDEGKLEALSMTRAAARMELTEVVEPDSLAGGDRTAVITLMALLYVRFAHPFNHMSCRTASTLKSAMLYLMSDGAHVELPQYPLSARDPKDIHSNSSDGRSNPNSRNTHGGVSLISSSLDDEDKTAWQLFRERCLPLWGTDAHPFLLRGNFWPSSAFDSPVLAQLLCELNMTLRRSLQMHCWYMTLSCLVPVTTYTGLSRGVFTGPRARPLAVQTGLKQSGLWFFPLRAACVEAVYRERVCVRWGAGELPNRDAAEYPLHDSSGSRGPRGYSSSSLRGGVSPHAGQSAPTPAPSIRPNASQAKKAATPVADGDGGRANNTTMYSNGGNETVDSIDVRGDCDSAAHGVDTTPRGGEECRDVRQVHARKKSINDERTSLQSALSVVAQDILSLFTRFARMSARSALPVMDVGGWRELCGATELAVWSGGHRRRRGRRGDGGGLLHLRTVTQIYYDAVNAVDDDWYTINSDTSKTNDVEHGPFVLDGARHGSDTHGSVNGSVVCVRDDKESDHVCRDALSDTSGRTTNRDRTTSNNVSIRSALPRLHEMTFPAFATALVLLVHALRMSSVTAHPNTRSNSGYCSFALSRLDTAGSAIDTDSQTGSSSAASAATAQPIGNSNPVRSPSFSSTFSSALSSATPRRPKSSASTHAAQLHIPLLGKDVCDFVFGYLSRRTRGGRVEGSTAAGYEESSAAVLHRLTMGIKTQEVIQFHSPTLRLVFHAYSRQVMFNGSSSNFAVMTLEDTLRMLRDARLTSTAEMTSYGLKEMFQQCAVAKSNQLAAEEALAVQQRRDIDSRPPRDAQSLFGRMMTSNKNSTATSAAAAAASATALQVGEQSAKQSQLEYSAIAAAAEKEGGGVHTTGQSMRQREVLLFHNFVQFLCLICAFKLPNPLLPFAQRLHSFIRRMILRPLASKVDNLAPLLRHTRAHDQDEEWEGARTHVR